MHFSWDGKERNKRTGHEINTTGKRYTVEREEREREREKVPQPLIIFKSVKGNDAREGRENVYLFLDSDITG